MKINFTKMQGCGNDYVYIDGGKEKIPQDKKPELARFVSNRNFGIGSDGLIFINPVDDPDIDFEMEMYNADGSRSEMCGNGIRCFAKYVYDKGYVDKKSFSVKTLAGIIKPELLDNGQIKVNMSKPILESKKIPFVPSENLNYKMSVKNMIFEGNAISMGNPHFVIFVSPDDDPLKFAKEYGPIIETSAEFPEKTNVEFVKIRSNKKLDLRVWERGCGITLACGTGACATVVAGVLNGYIENSVDVELLGGTVHIDWAGSKNDTNHDVFMTGPAEYSFEADVSI